MSCVVDKVVVDNFVIIAAFGEEAKRNPSVLLEIVFSVRVFQFASANSIPISLYERVLPVSVLLSPKVSDFQKKRVL